MNEVNYTSLTHPQNKSGAMRFAYCTLLFMVPALLHHLVSGPKTVPSP
jgi:hypothetical protein